MTEILMLLLFLLTTGVVAGLSAGLFGVGGGFVIVPALLYSFMQQGMTQSEALLLAIGTSLASIVLTSLRSLQAHQRKGSVDIAVLQGWAWPLAFGACAGVVVASYLSAPQLKWLFAIFVLSMSVRFLYPALLAGCRPNSQLITGSQKNLFGTLLGSLSAMLGIGGGSLGVILLTLAGRPLHQAIGTASGFGFCIALPSAIGFALMGYGSDSLLAGSVGYIHLPALVVVSLTSVWIAPKAARLAHALPELLLSRAFGCYLLCIGALMLR